VAIKVRLDDFRTITRARTLGAATADGELIGRVAVELLRANRPERPVRLLGVRLASFEDESGHSDHNSGGDGQTTLAVTEAA
jgi:DNA polymerase-4